MIKILFNLCPVLKHLVNVHHLSVEIRVVTLLLNNGHIALPLHKLHLFRNLTFLYFAFFLSLSVGEGGKRRAGEGGVKGALTWKRRNPSVCSMRFARVRAAPRGFKAAYDRRHLG